MCRAIKTLHNFTPPATDKEIRASSLQFVRRLSGFTRPSGIVPRANPGGRLANPGRQGAPPFAQSNYAPEWTNWRRYNFTS
jgi:hypothetical protein